MTNVVPHVVARLLPVQVRRSLRLERADPDPASREAARLYELIGGVQQAGRVCPHHRGRHRPVPPTEAQEHAIIATVAAALRLGFRAGALASLLRRSWTVDPCKPIYEQMRIALAAAVPDAGYVCAACQATTKGPSHVAMGWCGQCKRYTGAVG